MSAKNDSQKEMPDTSQQSQSVPADVSNYSGGFSVVTENEKIELGSLTFKKKTLKLDDLHYIVEMLIKGLPDFKNEEIKAIKFTLKREDC